MTVNTTLVEINYTGNASTTVFALPFAFAANAHVKVYLNGVLQNAGYSITGAGNPSGGTLTMTTAPGSGAALKARRVTPLTQDIDVVNNATVFASSLETGLDYALLREQEDVFDLGVLTARAVVVPIGETALTLPSLATRADGVAIFDAAGEFDVIPSSPGEFLGWDAGGVPVALSGTGTDAALRTDLASGPGDALVKTQMTGGLSRTLASKLADLPTVNDFTTPEGEASIDAFHLPSNVTKALADYPRKTYTGPGAISVNSEVYPLNDGSAKDAVFRTLGRVGNLAAFYQAIKNGAATVVFWGDSITEGVSQIAYEDSWAGLVEQHIRDQFPGVVWTFKNLSLAGLGFGEANSNVYVAADPAVPGVSFLPTVGTARTPPNHTLWPTAATLGDTWSEQVEAADPDLVIIALGMNHTGTAPADVHGALNDLVVNKIAGWAGEVSVALVAPMCPSRLVEVAGAGVAAFERVQLHADVIRSYAFEKDLTLIDANRLYRAYLDGVDIVQTRNRYEADFDDYASWVTVTTTRPATPVADVMTFAASGSVVRPDLERNVQISASLALSASVVGSILYRVDPAAPTTNRYEVQIQNGTPQVVLSHNATALASSALSGSSPWIVTVKAIGARHQVWVNGVLKIDVYDYRQMAAGYYGLKSSGAMTASAFTAKGGYRRAVGVAEAPERLLLGEVDDYATNIHSLGGNAINHPSQIGHHAVYFAAFAPLFDAIQRIEQAYKEPPIRSEVFALTGTPAAGDYLSIAVNSVQLSPQVTFIGGTGTNLAGATPLGFIDITAASATVDLILNAGTVLVTTTLTFPASGTYTVFAQGVASLAGANVRHVLTAWAERV